jgi:hypothetical protein
MATAIGIIFLIDAVAIGAATWTEVTTGGKALVLAIRDKCKKSKKRKIGQRPEGRFVRNFRKQLQQSRWKLRS